MSEEHGNGAMLSGDHLVTIPETVASMQVGEDTLVHDMITQRLHRLDAVGTRIWELIDAGHTVEVIVQTLAKEYQLPDDMPPSQLHDDVLAIVSDLHRLGLVLSDHAGSRILKSTNC